MQSICHLGQEVRGGMVELSSAGATCYQYTHGLCKCSLKLDTITVNCGDVESSPKIQKHVLS